MRKTSSYSRKRALGLMVQKRYDTVQRKLSECSEYSAENGTLGLAIAAKLKIRDGLTSLRLGTAEDSRPYDLMAHAINIAYIRSLEIGGVHNNPLMEVLGKAEAALARCLKRRNDTGKWRLDGPAISEITRAVELYEEILSASSPLQMANASRLREKILRQQLSQKRI